MRKIRAVYEVYKNGRYIGDTRAVSEAQAINNVRHSYFGDYESQYDGSRWSAQTKYESAQIFEPMPKKQINWGDM